MSSIGRKFRAALAPLALLGVGAASADDAPAPAPAVQAAPTTTAVATESPGWDDDLRAAIEGVLGTQVHGTLTTRYRLRTTSDATDQDIYQYLELRLGDESKDRVSGHVFARLAADLDRAHQGERGYVFESLDDSFDKSVNALLYTAYATIRPAGGPLESARVGRQYVFAADTFHMDGASATTRPLSDSSQLRFTAYAGVPVHFYESSSGGDWLAGLRAEAQPWTGGRTAFDWTHVQDRLSLLGERKNDLLALSAWQQVAKHLELYGQYSWLEGPRDVTLRATASFPDSDLLVQASYYRLVEDQKRLATEFDPYTDVIQDLVRYQQVDLRASKGLGEHFDVEIGASARQLLPGEDVGPFNRDTRRVYLTPSMTDLPWKGTSVSVTGESYTGDGERLKTWGFDVSQRFSRALKVSVGSDYSLYAFGPLGRDERSHVRTAYARVKMALTKSVSADVRYTWEKDDVETFHVLTLALTLDF